MSREITHMKTPDWIRDVLQPARKTRRDRGLTWWNELGARYKDVVAFGK